MVRREAAAEVGYLDPDFFVYYDECDFAKRLDEPAGTRLFVPAAEAIHHDQLSTDLAAGLPRIVEFHRNRDLYMRKHHGRLAALAVRLLTAWSYSVRALAATVLPDHPAGVYWAHARQALLRRGTAANESPRRQSDANRDVESPRPWLGLVDLGHAAVHPGGCWAQRRSCGEPGRPGCAGSRASAARPG